MSKVGVIYVPGAMIDGKRFNGAITLEDLKAATLNPAFGQIAEAAVNNPNYALLKRIQRQLQRPFRGGKKRNHFFYKEYIQRVVLARGAGQAPAIFLYTNRKLKVHRYLHFGKETAIIEIPTDVVLCAFDGETQLSAWHALKNAPKDFQIPIFIMHDSTIKEAQQCFHDLNRFGVNLSLGIAIQRDSRDPANNLLKSIEKHTEFFHERIAYETRSFRKVKGGERPPIVTAAAMRMFVRCVVEGEAALSHIHNPLLPDDKYNATKRKFAKHAANALVRLLATWEDNIVDSVLAIGTVWAAIGCALNTAFNEPDSAARKAKLAMIVADLTEVNWAKGLHWDGICVSYSPQPTDGTPATCRAMSVKHAGRATLKALIDKNDPGYRQIRT